MTLSPALTDSAVLEEIGARLRQTRLSHDLGQEQLAEQAGVSRWTIKRIEDGGSVQLTSLIRVLRALGLLEGLDAAIPEPGPSPIDALERHGAERKRASGRRRSDRESAGEGAWHWGDEDPGS